MPLHMSIPMYPNSVRNTRANYRVVVEMEATIHVPEDFDEAENCFLINFSNGQLLSSAVNEPKFTLYQKTKDRTKKKRVMVAETDHLTYVGTNYDPNSTAQLASANCSYCVGALDKKTGVMTLHRAQQFVLKPHIPGKTDIDDAATAEQQTPSKLDYRKSMDQMVNLFGSEKQKRAVSAAKRNLVDEGELDAALATAVSHVKKETEGVVSSESVSMQCSGLMPPHNSAAEAPQDVYNIEDIISLSEFKGLKKAAKVFVKATSADVSRWREENRYPEYVLQHIYHLPMKDPQRSLKAAMLLYASFLINMHNMNSRALEKEGLQFDGVSVPVDVKEQLLTNFTERQEGMGKAGKTLHTLSRRMKDKIRLHLFVLTLILDDFTVDCRALQQDLKLTTTKVMDHYKALGCAVTKTAVKRKLEDDDVDSAAASSSQQTSSCTAVLKIPLNFPNPKRGKRRT